MVEQITDPTVLPRFDHGDFTTLEATGATVDEWSLIADLELNEDELTILGYVINGVRENRIANLLSMTRVQVNRIKQGLTFEIAVDRLKRHRDSFLRSDVMGLKIKAMDVIAWYLTVDPEEMLKDDDGEIVLTEDLAGQKNTPIYRFSDRVKATLYREKRMAAALLAQDHLLADRVTKVEVTHQVKGNMEKPTIAIIQEEVLKLNSGEPNSIPTLAELEETVIEGDFKGEVTGSV